MSKRKSAQQCDEGGAYCGKPTGWRRGGRCARCRTAHNADLRRQRGLSEEQRQHFLSLLRAGQNVNQASSAAGVSAAKLAAAAAQDGELRAAIDGQPPAIQRIARLGDYLAALTRTGGDIPLAAYVAGINESSLRGDHGYRDLDPLFAAVEQAVLDWIDAGAVQPKGRVSDGQLDYAAQLLESGATMTEAARATGMSITTLRRCAGRSERLRAALPPLHDRSSPKKRTPQQEQLLCEIWFDTTQFVEDIARKLGVSKPTVTAWARNLGLPDRREVVRAARRRDPAGGRP